MTIIVHTIIFIVSALVVWFFAGILIDSVNRIAKQLQKNSFSVAFFILGFLTSISEISVAINASIDGVPEISVGNLVGASFVILLFIVPFLAVSGKGIEMNHTISKKNMVVAFVVITLPALLLIDGNVTQKEGVLALLVYLVLIWGMRNRTPARSFEDISEKLLFTKKIHWSDVLKIIVGGGAIFLAGHFLVEQVAYFSIFFGVPASLLGLILLSLGTNVPEFVIATRSILKKHKDIAFGDYLGSAAANTLIFGFLGLTNGHFIIESSEFFATALLMIVGLTLFYFFAASKHTLSRKEGFILLLFYITFLLIQVINIFRFGTEGAI